MTRVRKDVWGLGAGWSDTLEWYARGVRTLQSRPVTDRTSWWFLAAIHGMHPVVWREFGVIQASTPLPTPPSGVVSGTNASTRAGTSFRGIARIWRPSRRSFAKPS